MFLLRCAAIFALVLCTAGDVIPADLSSYINETAKLLAGIVPARDPFLAQVATNPDWLKVSKSFDAEWAGIEQDQVPQVKAWSAMHVPQNHEIAFYFFSGPDFTYANAVFPGATTYILSGMEPVGDIPNFAVLPALVREHAVECVRAPFAHFQNYGVFITAELEAAGKDCEFQGNLPLLLVLLARAGKTIRTVEFVEITQDGESLPARAPQGTSNVAGAKIEFEDKDRVHHSLYYFSTDLSDSGVSTSGFLKFCGRFGSGSSLLKGASYLLHNSNFSQTRNFILGHSLAVVEDDSGVPLKYFSPNDWSLRPFGFYRTPVIPFQSYEQPDLRALFQVHNAPAINFGFGYHWRAEEANLLVAVRKSEHSGDLHN